MKVELIRQQDQWPDLPTLTAPAKMLLADLALAPALQAMSQDDHYLAEIVPRTLCQPLQTAAEVQYCQAAVQAALQQPSVIQQLYDQVVACQAAAQKVTWGIYTGSVTYQLYSNTQLLQTYLNGINAILKLPLAQMPSANFQGFWQELQTEFAPAKRKEMQQMVNALTATNHDYAYPAQLQQGCLGLIAELQYLPAQSKLAGMVTGWASRYQTSVSDFYIAERDENSDQAAARNLGQAAYSLVVALINTTQELARFFAELRWQAGYLLAVTRLRAALPEATTITFPQIGSPQIQGLQNLTLLLANEQADAVIANDFQPQTQPLTLITGANQGGKTVFLRSLGQAQVMAQAGLFVAAQTCHVPIYAQVLTHFKREEDQQMTSGKLVEELQRFADLTAQAQGHELFLMNESFASTNAHEGALINREILTGLIKSGQTVVTVSHLTDLEELLPPIIRSQTLFLRAQREQDGQRTFKILAGMPEVTSYGVDIFNRYFQDVPNGLILSQKDKL
ncbi:MutS-related protein [Lapidilactobacillus salsurivasis]